MAAERSGMGQRLSGKLQGRQGTSKRRKVSIFSPVKSEAAQIRSASSSSKSCCFCLSRNSALPGCFRNVRREVIGICLRVFNEE